MEWPVDNRKCGGLSRVSFSLNGMERQAWICSTYLDHDQLHSHGDAYGRIVNGAWATMGGEPEVDLHWGRKSYWPNRLHEFEEVVMEWGWGSNMINTIPTSRFIQLLTMGRGIGDIYWAAHCAALLNAIGLGSSDNPVEKAAKVFSNAKHLGELLKVIANEKTYNERTQAQHYRQWSQQTKSTSTIY